MCGFAGEYILAGFPAAADLDTVEKMAGRLSHRGPDDTGAFISADRRCAMAFRRLSVVDLAHSHQPMSSADGACTVAFNGEIYNFQRLRANLSSQGFEFSTHGDTEVLPALWQSDGPKMLSQLNGMFAFALYDSRDQTLFLARDRLGQKPLWYAILNDRIAFASEAKALLAHPQVRPHVDPAAISYYLTLGYIPAPLTAWRGISKLLPAHSLQFGPADAEQTRYWQPLIDDLPTSRDTLVDMVRTKVTDAIGSRLLSDVPLGALLSGGVDSSIIVAVMAELAGKTGGVRTFTAGFAQNEFDERPAAAATAAHCGTLHTELLIHPEVNGAIDRIISQYDEPFADSSALPTYLICSQAREHVTVALAGDGGDEVFAGYDRYRAMKLASQLGAAGYFAMRLAGTIARFVAPKNERNRLRRLARFADGLPYPPALQYLMYRGLFLSNDLERLVRPDLFAGLSPQGVEEWFCNLYESQDLPDEVAYSQHHDLMTYLPDDILVKTDIASMAASLELRAPFLDHNVVSLGLALPADLKVPGKRGSGKSILRDAFGDLLPPEVFRRPKKGFGVPLGDWLREELKPELQETLLTPAMDGVGIFHPEAVAGLINDHVSGKADHRHRLWAMLVLAKWLQKFPLEAD